jgi:transposase
MSGSANSDRTFVGIDVAKRTLDVALGSQCKSRTFNSDPTGLAQLVQYVQQVAGPQVCLEATGGYERSLLEVLDQASIFYTVSNPAKVRNFARADGKLDKTDGLDARALALFGERMQPEPTTPVSPQQARLKDLHARREQIVEHITREKHRLEITRQRDIQRLIQIGLRAADKELTKLDKLLKKAIAEDEVMRKNAELLASVPGVGETTAAKLIALVPELGKLTRRKIARLAGLRRLLATAANSADAASSAAAERPCERLCTCPRSSPSNTIHISETSISDSSPTANPNYWQSPPPPENY